MKKFMVLMFILLPCAGNSQDNKWFMETAIRLTTDAEAFFLAPSFSLGAGKHITSKWSVAGGYTFFGDSYQVDETTRWTTRTHTFDITPNYHFPATVVQETGKGFHVGLGLAYQFQKDTPEYFQNTSPSYLTFSLEGGYCFSFADFKRPSSIAISLKAYGPYLESSSSGSYIEIFTQIMLGVRWRY